MNSDQIGIFGLIISVLGFGVTIWQVVRGANAAVATKNALTHASQRMAANHLLILLPQLKGLETDLETATAEGDRRLAIRTLVTYRDTAIQVAQLLESDEGSDFSETVIELRDSADVASHTKALLVKGTRKLLPNVLEAAYADVGKMCSKAAGLITHYQARIN